MRKSNSCNSHHTECHLAKKQPQAKIAIAFLFGQLHFNNVTSHALFYGGHLVMRSKRCAVQNQGITTPRRGRVTAMLNFKVGKLGRVKGSRRREKEDTFLPPPPPPSRSFALTPTPRDDIVTLFKLFQR